MFLQAVLHAEQKCLSRAWSKWVSRALQQREDRFAEAKAEMHYTNTLLNKMLKLWKHRVKDIQIGYEIVACGTFRNLNIFRQGLLFNIGSFSVGGSLSRPRFMTGNGA